MSIDDTLVAVGTGANSSNEGWFNSAVGAQSLAVNVSASSTTALGYGAGSDHNGGVSNLFAGANSKGVSGNHKVVVGAGADSKTYSDCIVLGFNAAATADGDLVLGSADAPLTTAGVPVAVPTNFTDTLTVIVNGVARQIPLL